MSTIPAPTIWHIPYQRNRLFTGREEVLTHLHSMLQADARVALSHPLGISGLGGIGKTQTALEYAYRYQSEYEAVFWVRADSMSLTSSVAGLAEILQLPECDEQDQQVIVQAVLRWFRLHTGWLLIYDNVDDLSAAKPFLATGDGHLLLTTRAHALEGLAQRLDVQKMEPQIGALFLFRKAGLLALQDSLAMASADDQQSAQAISQELGGLPLALDQAGAYIKETACTLSDYLQSYQTRRSDLLRERGGFDQDYPASVATTWSLSFDKVRQADPAATALLNLCAYLSPDAISEKMITDGASYLPSALKKIVHPLQFDRVLSSLLAYSLLYREESNATISIHRLVQAVLQDNMPGKKQQSRNLIQRFFHKLASREPETQEHWKRCAVRVVHAASPLVLDVQQWGTCELWLPHALVGMIWLEEYPTLLLEVPVLVVGPGSYLFTRGRYREAEPLCKRALALCERQVGAEHALTAACLSNLGELYLTQGRHTEAEPLFERALAILERQLGAEHVGTATLVNNLGGLYMEQGNYAKAEPLYLRALDIRERKLGAEPAPMIESLSNLGSLYIMQGRYAEAEPLLERAMQINEQQLGAKHLLTGMGASMNNVVYLYRSQGKDAEADAVARRALELNEQIVGPEHLLTANSLNYQALVYLDQKKYGQAEALNMRVLAMREQQLGTEHPDVAISLNNLAEGYREQGKYAEAEPLYLRALSIWGKWEDDHPFRALLLSNFALLYENQKRYAEAEPLCMRALAIRELKLGAEHPDTISSLGQLAALYQKQEKYAEAEPLYVRLVAMREQQLGTEHPDVATSLNDLAEAYREQGNYAEAEPLYLHALAIREHLLEVEHADTASDSDDAALLHETMLRDKIIVLLGLTLLYKIQGKYTEAEPLYVQVLAIKEKIHGVDNPHIVDSLINLADIYKRQRKYAEAEPLYLRALTIREQELGVNHPDLVIILSHLAGIYDAQERFAEAESFYQRVLVIDTNAYGTEHLEVATDLNSLAALYRTEGRYAEAEPLYVRALAIREQKLEAEHLDIAQSLNNLAVLYETQGKYALAGPLYQRSLAIYELRLGAEHSYTQTVRVNYAALVRMEDRLGKLTARARNVLSLAQEEARGLQLSYIGPEHLLLGLVRESEGSAASPLSDLGIELQKVRGIVKFVTNSKDRIAQDEIGLTLRAKKAVEFAEEEALQLNQHSIEAEHLLLGLVRDTEGIAMGILESLGVNLGKMRARAISILSTSE